MDALAEPEVPRFARSAGSFVGVRYSEIEAFRQAQHLLADSMSARWRHVQGVAARARVALPIFSPADSEVLLAAAILHDIGYSASISHTGFHALDGARFLKENGTPERICGLVAHHSCAYIEAELRGLSAELAEWRDEESPVRDALWWADMTTTPLGKPTNVNDRIREVQYRYGPESLVTFFIRQAQSELVDAVERTEERLWRAGLATS